MFGDRSATTRSIAVTIAAVAILLANAAPADAKVTNIWSNWATAVVDRSPYEVPFAVLISLPAMIVTTPFWAGDAALDLIQNAGAEDADADDADEAASADDEADEAAGSDTDADDASSDEAASDADDEAADDETGSDDESEAGDDDA